jgi:predicted nucleic acid-binding protein
MVTDLAAGVPDGSTVLVDSSPIIYVLEAHPLAAGFRPLFADIDAGRIQALITPVTLAEVVTGPLRAGNEALAERYRQALTMTAGWSLREIDAEIAILAARLGLQHRLKLADAVQLATALHEGCFGIVTHDRDFGGAHDLVVLGPE